ncbi:YciI-like protein [Roseivivax jejudonensis]|uniref:YciI-like protein n=1 Tax=Roseivivax jejudonensis TaxID=1529041 RepID=A0A1X6ZVS8_9RHOB|nr:YciI family protein [Roseivivax jejudonensis]SLN62723.1 YciI-like protein [Roseivivax jejudonensis]
MTEPLRSVPAADVKQASREMLQKQLYAIFTSPVDGMAPVFEHLEAHLAYQVQLEADGVLYSAGPMWTDDEQSWEGDGLVVVRAETREAAIRIAEADPMHKAGARAFRVRPWMINEGSVTVRLDLSSQRFEIV